MYSKCPGQDSRNLRVSLYRCPNCGARISKSDIQLLKDFGCADWCDAAEKCLGSELYTKLKRAKEGRS